MTEYDGRDFSTREAKYKAEKMRNDMMNAMYQAADNKKVVVNEARPQNQTTKRGTDERN